MHCFTRNLNSYGIIFPFFLSDLYFLEFFTYFLFLRCIRCGVYRISRVLGVAFMLFI